MELLSPDASVLAALRTDRQRAARLLRVSLPDGWPEHPEAMTVLATVLRDRAQDAPWHLLLFVDRAAGVLVGDGGFKGPPNDGEVEVGYEVAPQFRDRGYATAAVRRLVARAFADHRVRRVVAHTLPESNASVAVLRRIGFRRDGSAPDPEVGTVWRWALTAPERADGDA